MQPRLLCVLSGQRGPAVARRRLVVGFALDSVAFRSGKKFSANDLTNAARHATMVHMTERTAPRLPTGDRLTVPRLALALRTATPVHKLRGGADCLIRGWSCASRSRVGRVEGWFSSFLTVRHLISALGSGSSAWVLSLFGGFVCFARFALSDLVVSSRPSLLGSLAIARGIQKDGDGQVVSTNPIYPFVERS